MRIATLMVLLRAGWLLAQSGSRLGPQEVRVGIILERVEFDQQLIQREFQSLNRHLHPSINLTYRYMSIGETDPFRVVRSVCRWVSEGYGLLVSVASCLSSAAVAGLAQDKRLPHVAVSFLCHKYYQDLERQEYTFPLITDAGSTVDEAAAAIIKSEKWTSVVFIHDEEVDASRVRDFGPRLKNHSKEIKYFEFRVAPRENNGGGTRKYLTPELEAIFRDGELFNFVVTANEEATVGIIKEAQQIESVNPIIGIGSYDWIVTNQELTRHHLRSVSPESRMVALLRREQHSKTSASYGGRQVEYLLDAVQILARVVNSTAQQINWRDVRSLACDIETTAVFGDGDKLSSAMRNLRMEAKSGFVIYSHDRLEVFTQLDVWRTVNPESKEPSPEGAQHPIWENVGEWNYHDKLKMKGEVAKAFASEKSSLQGMNLRIVTIVERPFIIREVGPDGGNVSYSGCCIDILNAIQSELKREEVNITFNYQLYEVADNKYGIVDPATHKWNGLIGDILYKKADMAVAGMIRNYERELVVDFTASYMDYGVSILIAKPEKMTSYFDFLKPLTVQVWICISVATFAVGTMLFLLARLSPYSKYNQWGVHDFSFKNSMWFALASLMQQGGDATPVTVSGRILGTFWWFFSLIIIATYTANLAAFLTVTRMITPIESLQDLADQSNVPYGTVADSSLQFFFKEQRNMDALYERIWTYMSETEPTPMVKDEEEGLTRVLDGNYAFLWDDPVLQFHRKLHCHKLAVVGKPFNKKNYAFAVPKGAPYWHDITLSILRLQESGELDKIKQKWFEGESSCDDREDSMSGSQTAEGIELNNVAGVFYILVIGAFLSFITCVTEYIWYKFLSLDQPPDQEPPPDSRPYYQREELNAPAADKQTESAGANHDAAPCVTPPADPPVVIANRVTRRQKPAAAAGNPTPTRVHFINHPNSDEATAHDANNRLPRDQRTGHSLTIANAYNERGKSFRVI